ncbi:AAA family ATPase [Carnimonas bestiolae]|uniref:AAA family ATPase n=1 Tax=Carnimonas bestiolae TaxID=3402172 RepID=UPI003EDC7205
MYKIFEVKIDGFWHRFDAKCRFNNDVNIVIGRNGTGKTTFINIINSILTVDAKGLVENEFCSVKIILKDSKNKTRTIEVQKNDNDDPIVHLEYKISTSKYSIAVSLFDDRRLPMLTRRRMSDQILQVKQELNSLVSISSLSVYRMRNTGDDESRDSRGSKVVSPVDRTLTQALYNLTEYQLGIVKSAQEVSEKLQKEVLASILYSEEDGKKEEKIPQFNREEEEQKLIETYAQLGVKGTMISKKIRLHTSAIEKTLKKIKESDSGSKLESIDLKPLEAFIQSKKIITLSLEAQKETEKIYSQLNLFIKILKDFIVDKDIGFSSGKLTVSGKYGEVDIQKLSSGEKQLIILMAEALLQNKNEHIFLTDEPELSLHIRWQRNIIPAVKEINPNSQVIVATHSPEIASKYSNNIFDMESLIDG